MTTIPTWAALCAAVGTPLLAFLGVIVAQRITRRGVTELELGCGSFCLVARHRTIGQRREELESWLTSST